MAGGYQSYTANTADFPKTALEELLKVFGILLGRSLADRLLDLIPDGI
jgi:hypothetical protein